MSFLFVNSFFKNYSHIEKWLDMGQRVTSYQYQVFSIDEEGSSLDTQCHCDKRRLAEYWLRKVCNWNKVRMFWWQTKFQTQWNWGGRIGVVGQSESGVKALFDAATVCFTTCQKIFILNKFIEDTKNSLWVRGAGVWLKLQMFHFLASPKFLILNMPFYCPFQTSDCQTGLKKV